jgi:hypothetical protein
MGTTSVTVIIGPTALFKPKWDRCGMAECTVGAP